MNLKWFFLSFMLLIFLFPEEAYAQGDALILNDAITDLSERKNIPEDTIQIMYAYTVVWSHTHLNCVIPGDDPYSVSRVTGLHVVFVVNGNEFYEYRSDFETGLFRLCNETGSTFVSPGYDPQYLILSQALEDLFVNIPPENVPANVYVYNPAPQPLTVLSIDLRHITISTIPTVVLVTFFLIVLMIGTVLGIRNRQRLHIVVYNPVDSK